MKILFTYNTQTREGYESRLPGMTKDIESDSVDEIASEDCLEKVPDLIAFIDECYRILIKGRECKFSVPHFASTRAWVSPLTRRAFSEHSLNFASKEWRDQYKYTEAVVLANFEVAGQVALNTEVLQRSEDARIFWMQRYCNVAEALLFTLTKL